MTKMEDETQPSGLNDEDKRDSDQAQSKSGAHEKDPEKEENQNKDDDDTENTKVGQEESDENKSNTRAGKAANIDETMQDNEHHQDDVAADEPMDDQTKEEADKEEKDLDLAATNDEIAPQVPEQEQEQPDEQQPQEVQFEEMQFADQDEDDKNVKKAYGSKTDVDKNSKDNQDKDEDVPMDFIQDDQNKKKVKEINPDDIVQTFGVGRDDSTIFGMSGEAAISSRKVKKTDDETEMEVALVKSEDDDKMAGLTLKWHQVTGEMTGLIQSTTEQLRLILEPTKRSRFKGDYRSGKRLNMRKVIPFIASNYRKDKIWLRRTKPAKMEYNIVVAVDDSVSMKFQEVDAFVNKSLVVLCQTFSGLEVGQLGLVKYGAKAEIVTPLKVTAHKKS